MLQMYADMLDMQITIYQFVTNTLNIVVIWDASEP